MQFYRKTRRGRGLGVKLIRPLIKKIIKMNAAMKIKILIDSFISILL